MQKAMTVKRKDFQKTAAYIHEFLLKLSEDPEAAELRDALNLALLHMQKYYRFLQARSQSYESYRMAASATFSSPSLRGLSPMTPFRDAPDKFVWRWVNLEQTNHSISRSLPHGIENGGIVSIPLIHQACKACDLDTMEELFVKHRSVINEVDALGRTPLMYASHFEHNDAVRWLLDKECDVNTTAHDESTALHWACRDGNWQAVDLLLRFGADHRKCDTFGRAAIHWAVTTATTQCLKLLILYSANVNIRDRDGLSPSMWACRLDNIEHFSIISQVTDQQIEEADGMERDLSGRTWLHWSVRRTEPLECLKTLLSEDNVALRDDDGKTVMLIAAETGSLAACRLIVETAGKESIHDKDDQDRTPLHLATIGGHGECVNYLLEKGADTERRDKANATAWDYAHQRNLQYCMLIIASHCRQRGSLNQEVSASTTPDLGDVKPKTPPRPPTTPPPRDKSPTPRRHLKKISSDSDTQGIQTIGPNPNGTIPQRIQPKPRGHSIERPVNGTDLNRTNSEEDDYRGFDRRESEDIAINSFGDNSPPVVEANGVDDIDHVSIDNMNVSDIDEDAAPSPPATARRAEARPVHQPRPPSGRQLMRSQPPPMLPRSKPQPQPRADSSSPSFPVPMATSPPTVTATSPTAAPRVEIVEEEQLTSMQPPRTPPEAKRKPVLPPQLVPLSTSTKREKKKKKKRRAREMGHLQMIPPAHNSLPPSGSDDNSGFPNGPQPFGISGSGYTRPLHPPMGGPVPAARSSQSGRFPSFPGTGGGGNSSGRGSSHEDSAPTLTPRQEVIPPPRGFRNDSSTETTPRDPPAFVPSNRVFAFVRINRS